MIAGQAYRVLTEFRFEAGSAIATSGQLQSAVSGISGAADEALFSLRRLGIGVVSYLGPGMGGVIGTLYSAITSADKFTQSQIKIATMFQSAGFFKGPEGFAEALTAGSEAMERIQKTAQKFSLPAADLLGTASLIAPALMSKGLDDSSMTKSLDLSRQFLKANPILGTDPGMAMGQLMGMVMGRTDMGGQFTQRLFADTKSLKGYSGQGGTQKFNALDPAKRIELLTSALGEFANNTKAAEAIAGTLNGQMQLMKDNLFGVFSVFRELGSVLIQPILQVFRAVNEYLKTQAPQIVANLSALIKPYVEDPKALIVNLLQLRSLKEDTLSAGKVLAVIGAFEGLYFVLGMLGIRAQVLTMAMNIMQIGWLGLGKILGLIGRGLMFLTGSTSMIGMLFSGLNLIVMVVSRLLLPLALLVALFQLISRAIAIARVNDATAFLEIMPRFTAAMAYLNKAFLMLIDPFVVIFNAVATAIAPIFQFSHWLEALVWIINLGADALVLFQAGFQGVVFVILQFVENLKAAFTGESFNIFGNLGAAFDAGTNDVFERIFGRISNAEGDPATSNKITQIDKIEINNQFKEQQEPDRIAFTLRDQLVKAATNPLQAAGRSMRTANVGL